MDMLTERPGWENEMEEGQENNHPDDQLPSNREPSSCAVSKAFKLVSKATCHDLSRVSLIPYAAGKACMVFHSTSKRGTHYSFFSV